jgi:hypothetical protein
VGVSVVGTVQPRVESCHALHRIEFAGRVRRQRRERPGLRATYCVITLQFGLVTSMMFAQILRALTTESRLEKAKWHIRVLLLDVGKV